MTQLEEMDFTMNLINRIDDWFCEFTHEKTCYYRDKYGFSADTTTHNNANDAFKHCYTSAILTMFITPCISKYFTDRHEWKGINKQNAVESVMDLYNNRIGRSVGLTAIKWMLTFKYSEDRLAKLIISKIYTNQLICSLSDKRISDFLSRRDSLGFSKAEQKKLYKALYGE